MSNIFVIPSSTSTTSRSRLVENPLIRVQISQIHFERGNHLSTITILLTIPIEIPFNISLKQISTLSICDDDESIKPCLQDKPTIRAKNHERKRDKRVVVYEARKDSIQSTVTSCRRIATILISAFIIVSLGW